MKRPTALSATVGLALLLSAPLAGCGGPVGPMPGFALDGPSAMQPVNDFLFARYLDTLHLEIRPESPYSVEVGFVEREGRIYVAGRSWAYWVRGLMNHPDARISLAAEIYDVTAVQVTDPRELEVVDESGVVFRLDPRAVPEVVRTGS
jgi:hypothetical protein